jgi:hypothetical protein
MATLSGNTIQSTYQGLLKLADSTTGITSTLQTLQDGLGNDVGGVEVNDVTFKTTSNYHQPFFKMTYAGQGIGSTTYIPQTQQFAAITRTTTCYAYDMGVNSYSAFTYSVGTQGLGTEVYNFAFYDAKLHPTFGLVPNNRLTDVYNIPSNDPIGFYTIPFSSPLTFPGGVYFIMWQIWGDGNTNGTLRLRVQAQSQPPMLSYGQMLGLAEDTTSTLGQGRFFNAFGTSSAAGLSYPVYNNLGFPLVCTDGDLTTTRVTGVSLPSSQPGFLLNTIF